MIEVLFKVMKFLASKLAVILRKLISVRSQRKLKANKALWSALSAYIEQSSSTGCSYIDYYEIYEYVRRQKPLEILECGTGVSTLVIAHALLENYEETGNFGQLTSMEESENWLEISQKLLPDIYAKFVDFRLSKTIDDAYSLFRGVRYEFIPKKNYDFVFVDGPKYVSPSDGMYTFDFDFIHILKNASNPVSCMIDKRISTIFVLQQLLGAQTVTYSAIKGIGYVKPSTKSSLGTISHSLSSHNFSSTFSIFRNSLLSITKNK